MTIQNDLSETLDLAITLVNRQSITPKDAGCQEVIKQRLKAIGFAAEPMRFGEVDNLWARRGTQKPLLAFVGHTDVVPPGPLQEWTSPPFQAEIRDGLLYGRGSADMKGSIAAMVTACERFVADHPNHKGSIAFLVTSDEEGPSINGTVKVIERLQTRGDIIDLCLVGEPSSTAELGDVIKNGRRGSLNGHLTIKGVQGHVAYPHLAENPIHTSAPVVAQLCDLKWDTGNAFFPPTAFQVSNIHSGTGAENVIPGNLELRFNIRYSTESTAEQLKQKVHALLDSHDLKYELDWKLSGEPFLTPSGELVETACAAIREITGRETKLSTSGGTSDGRFVATMGAQIIELGPVNGTIHMANECTSVVELDTLSQIYQRMLEGLLV